MYENRRSDDRTVQRPQRPRTFEPNRDNKARPAAPKGHDAIIKALQDSGRTLYLTTLNGDQFYGKVVGRDKFTITLLREVGGQKVRHVFYKHALESFYGEEAEATPPQS